MGLINNNESSFFSSTLTSDLSLPSLSSLGGEVLNDFNRLHNGSKGVFRRLYNAVFNWLYPRSKLDSFHLFYSIVDVLQDFSFPYPLLDFLYFCKLYHFSGGGVQVIDSRTFNNNTVDRNRITNLIKLGFVSRSSFLPSSPYLIKNRCTQKVFISLTVDGVAFYNKVLVEVYKHAKADLYQLTKNEQKKKGRKT